MIWLLTATEQETRRCKQDECTKVVSYEQPEQTIAATGLKKNDRSLGYRARKDKEFCRDRCRALYHYYHVRKGKSQSSS